VIGVAGTSGPTSRPATTTGTTIEAATRRPRVTLLTAPSTAAHAAGRMDRNEHAHGRPGVVGQACASETRRSASSAAQWAASSC
jgi:hypothetical protein